MNIADILFTFYLLIVFPLRGLLRKERPAAPALPALQAYWRQARYVLLLLAGFAIVVWQGGHSARELGLDVPLSASGTWGLVFAGGLLASLPILGKRMEGKQTAEARREQQEKLREQPFTIPRSKVEIIAYVVTMVGMTATWEILFRGYLLLVLAPYCGMPLAVALAAIAYGAAHGYKNAKQFIVSIVAALAFTIAYALTGSLWWLIVLHAAAPLAVLLAAKVATAEQPVQAAAEKSSASW